MRIGIPHMGNMYIPLKAVAEELNADLVVPPYNNRETLSLGARYSPEAVCIPFKLTLGNLIQASQMGADILLMPGGSGVCRLGYYAKLQQAILRELGYDVEIMRVELSEKKLLGLLSVMRRLTGNASWLRILAALRFGLTKLASVDKIERAVQKVRAVELVKGDANRIYRKAIKAIDSASDDAQLERTVATHLKELSGVKIDAERQPLLVGITGEIYVLLEPFSNLDIESELGRLGVLVRRSTFISDWVRFSFFLNAIGLSEHARVHRAAKPYLKRDVGGDGWESVGDKILHAREYDGLIHLAPFTCTPETVAANIMQKTREKLPVLTVLCDEQMGKAGLITRLEAFTDLLERRRKMRDNRQGLKLR